MLCHCSPCYLLYSYFILTQTFFLEKATIQLYESFWHTLYTYHSLEHIYYCLFYRTIIAFNCFVEPIWLFPVKYNFQSPLTYFICNRFGWISHWLNFFNILADHLMRSHHHIPLYASGSFQISYPCLLAESYTGCIFFWRML